MKTIEFNRRTFLAGSCAALLAPATATRAQDAPATGMEYLLSGGMVLDLGGNRITMSRNDIHIRNGEIVTIGPSLAIPGAERIDVSGMLVSPGLVDTHWHMWNTLARGFAMSRLGPFAKTMAALAKVWTPEASALSVQLAMAEAALSGITTVHNWAHNVKAVEFAEAELAAMRASGLRGRFSYGYPNILPPDQKMDFRGFAAFAAEHFRSRDDGLIELGLCTRGPDRSLPDIWQEEWHFARDRRLPITTHIASDRKSAAMGNIARMAEGGFLGPDVQLVHATHATADDFAKIASSHSPLSISPWTELEVGYGVTPVAAMMKAGLKPGLSVDNMILAGTADMFSVMKVTADLAAGEAETQSALPDDEVLRWATVDGAHGMGLADKVGLLKQGMRADIIAIRLDDLNTLNAASPSFLMSHAARPENVDMVMIDGVVHKRGGKLMLVDEAETKARASELIAALIRKADI